MQRTVLLCFCLAAISCSKQMDQEPMALTDVPIRINEVFAASTQGDAAQDNTGDWLELYNAGPALPLAAGEWFLTDDRDDLLKFELTGVPLDQQGYLRIWCDGKEGADHANFKLSSKGEWLAVVRVVHGRAAIIDSVHYKAQRGGRGLTASRYPDGAHVWMTRTPGTPGAPNNVPLQEQTLSAADDPSFDD